MPQEIALYNKIQDPIAGAQAMGQAFAKSGLFGCQTTEAGTVLALACLAENKTPFEVIRTYDIVDGKLRKKALAIAAEFRAKGGQIRWIKTGTDGQEAEAEFSFEGQTIKEKFNIEDAKRMNLVRPNSNWVKTPANMLRARVLSNAIAMLAPEIVAGMVEGEENDEGPAEPKPIFSEPKPAAEPVKTEKAKKSASQEVIDIPVEVAAEPPPAQEELPLVKAEVDPKTGKLTDATCIALESAFGTHGAKALKWLEEKKWIKPMGSLKDLTLPRASMILQETDKFLKHIGA